MRFKSFRIFIKYVIAIIILFFSLSTAFANINLQGQMPHAQFISINHDFGTISQGQKLGHLFEFQNTGNGILVLTSLHASCGCVNARSLSEHGNLKNIFRPGEKGKIAVDFDSSQFSGHVEKTILVETNADEKQSSTILTLSAIINQELAASPSLLYLGKISKKNQKNYYISLIRKKRNIQIISIDSDLPFIETSLIPNNQNPLKTTIMIKIKQETSLPTGPFQGKIIVKNSSKFNQNLIIPIMGDVINYVQASTKYIEFGVVKFGKAEKRTLRFKSSDKNFEINKIDIQLNKLAYQNNFDQKEIFEVSKIYKHENKEFYEYVFNLSLKYPNNRSTHTKALLTGVNVSGNFIIYSNDPDYTEIKVPFFGILKYE